MRFVERKKQWEMRRRPDKIPKTDLVPLGWEKGRVMNFSNHGISVCKCCKLHFNNNGKTNIRYCGSQCKQKAHDNRNYKNNPFFGREDEFYELYDKYRSLNRVCKEMGFPGAISHWYKHSKQLLDKIQIE